MGILVWNYQEGGLCGGYRWGVVIALAFRRWMVLGEGFGRVVMMWLICGGGWERVVFFEAIKATIEGGGGIVLAVGADFCVGDAVALSVDDGAQFLDLRLEVVDAIVR